MSKRQASQKNSISHIFRLFIVLSSVFLLIACTPTSITTPTSTTTPTEMPLPAATTTTPNIISPTPTIEPTVVTPSVTPTTDCLQLGGTVEQQSFTSELSGEEFEFRVYLPACYGAALEQTYPVIYLLHGLLFNDDQWLRLGLVDLMDELIANQEVSPALVVLPQESLLLDPQTALFSELIVSELVPWIDDNYSTNPERTFRAIGGLSRGAGWAVQIGFDNPQLFSRIGAHSLPLFETDSAKITGWLTQIPKEDYPAVFMDIGRDDPEWQTAQAFADQLDKFQVPHQWYLFTGGHTETYWASHLELYLRWYLQDW